MSVQGCEGNREFAFNGDRGSVWDDGKLREMDRGGTTI